MMSLFVDCRLQVHGDQEMQLDTLKPPLACHVHVNSQVALVSMGAMPLPVCAGTVAALPAATVAAGPAGGDDGEEAGEEGQNVQSPLSRGAGAPWGQGEQPQ